MLGSMWLYLDLFEPDYGIISCLLTRIENWIILTQFSQTEKFLTRNGTGTQGTMPIEYGLLMVQRIKMEHDNELATQANISHVLFQVPTLIFKFYWFMAESGPTVGPQEKVGAIAWSPAKYRKSQFPMQMPDSSQVLAKIIITIPSTRSSRSYSEGGNLQKTIWPHRMTPLTTVCQSCS